MTVAGAIPLETDDTTGCPVLLPSQLLDGGEHFDDDATYSLRRRIEQTNGDRTLPRDVLREHVTSRDLRRPARNVQRNGESR